MTRKLQTSVCVGGCMLPFGLVLYVVHVAECAASCAWVLCWVLMRVWVSNVNMNVIAELQTTHPEHVQREICRACRPGRCREARSHWTRGLPWPSVRPRHR